MTKDTIPAPPPPRGAPDVAEMAKAELRLMREERDAARAALKDLMRKYVDLDAKLIALEERHGYF